MHLAHSRWCRLCVVCRHKGRPHWGKCFERVHASTACPIRDLYPNMDKQLQLQTQYDPAKLFETALMTDMLSGGKDTFFPACTKEMQCYCQDNEHCGGAGLTCQTAPAPLPPYRICMPAQ